MAVPFLNILKSNITGHFELTRMIGGLGGLSYLIGVHAFLYWKVIHLGQDFPLETYCLAYPTGLAALGGSTAAASALKDRQTATSQIIASTGAVPAKPPEGPRVPVNQMTPVGDETTGPAPPGMPEPANL